MPYRVDNIVAFAGERLFAASLGSGVFWMPLSPAGEKPVTAKPLVVASAPVNGTPPAFQNLNFDAAGETPPNWIAETRMGTVKLLRDTQITDKNSVASLQISSEGGPASGSVYQDCPASLWRFKVSGRVRAKGEFTKVQVALQPFDASNQPLTPIVLGTAKPNQQWWSDFGKTVTLPPSAVRVRLEQNFEGQGQIWTDEFKVTLPEPLFPQ